MDTTVAAAAWAQDQLRTLQEDFHDYNPAVVPTLPYPSPLDFSKLVSRGQPCLFQVYGAQNATYHRPWPACSWTREEMQSKVSDKVEVALTPNGNADALVSLENEQDGGNDMKVFVQPASRQYSLTQLFDKLSATNGPQDKTPHPVCYLQSQNSNLTSTPLEPLLSDLPQNFDFAEGVLGEPDARNIWIGDERSVTSVHRDPYENLYLVLRGSKTFRLWAPVDESAMPTQMVRTAQYEYFEDRRFEVIMDATGEIPWVDLDPLAPGLKQVGRMRTVTVQPGQMLYLPAGWFHHVTQQCGQWDNGSPAPCIAVNYWYDQDYEGERYVMRQLMSRLVEMSRTNN